jgi:hypothetical protein
VILQDVRNPKDRMTQVSSATRAIWKSEETLEDGDCVKTETETDYRFALLI